MTQNDVFDALRIDADFSNVTDDPVHIGFLSGVEEDVAFGRCEQPDGNVAGPHVIKVVEDLKGLYLLEFHIVGSRHSVGLAQWLRSRLGCGERRTGDRKHYAEY